MERSKFIFKLNALTGVLGIITAALFAPVLFSIFFSLGQLSSTQENYLWIFSSLLFMVSVAWVFFRAKLNSGNVAIFSLTVIAILFIELSVRLGINLFGSQELKSQLIACSEMSYGLSMAYEGHPFTQFTGKGGTALKGTPDFGNLPPYNNYGFPDLDFERDKPQNVIRIACIGESTTADGYPAYLEENLNKSRTQLNTRYETMCFAQPMWTTQHTMVAFLSTVVDFKPDYLVIHHGWNEGKVRNCLPGDFKTDYSHHFKSFGKTEAFDAMLIRVSVVYRLIKFWYDKTPQWMNMGAAIEKDRKQTALTFSDTTELYPYKRNLETIVTMAKFYGIKTVMTTLPHSTDSTIEFYYSVPNIEQCNAINRSIAAKYSSEILFCDLDSAITGKYNLLFNDLGHVEADGLMLKANLIAPVILRDAAEKEAVVKTLPVDYCRKIYVARSVKRMLFNREWRSQHNALTEDELATAAKKEAAELFDANTLDITVK